MTPDIATLREFCGIAARAGHEIMRIYGSDVVAWQKDDASPVTAADLRADEAIRAGLAASFPGVPVISEESARPDIEPGVPFFLVDPLDGTKEFLGRTDEFTVNIALIDGGRPVAGVVLVPALDQVYFAGVGLGAWRRDSRGEVRLRTCMPSPGAPLRVIGSRSHNTEAVSAWLDRLATSHTFVAAGSSLKFCRIAEGAADVYPRLGPTCQWDTAAAQAVLECAGGAVLDPQGRELAYGPDRPVLNPFFIALAQRGLDLPPLE